MPALQHVVLLDKIDISAKNILAENAIKVDVFEKFTEIPAASLKSLDGLIVRSATKVTAEVMAQCPALRIIGRAGTGVDNIDVPEATRKGIIVMNTPGGNTISAAEHTCFMIVALARNGANNNAIMKTHKWSKGAGQELMGKTLGIVGLGRIGMEVATRMQAFGMTTIGFDPIVSAETAAQSNVEWVSLEDMWPKCDYITVHVPLIPQTKDLVCTKTLALCKKGVKIVNVARGGIVSETDILEALNSGQCGGAGLDVFVDEPVKDWTLIDHPNVVATAHLGASTKEGQLKCGQEIATSFVHFSTGASSLNGIINSQALVASFSAETAPWLALGTGLAKLVAAAAVPKEVQIEIVGSGYPANLVKIISPAVAAGVASKVDSSANLVSGPGLAEKEGVKITVSENKSDSTAELRISAAGKSVTGVVSNGVAYLKSVNGAQFPEAFAVQSSSGVLFMGSVAGSSVGGVLTSLQACGLQRVNLASAGGDVVLVGVCQKADATLAQLGVHFAS